MSQQFVYEVRESDLDEISDRIVDDRRKSPVVVILSTCDAVLLHKDSIISFKWAKQPVHSLTVAYMNGTTQQFNAILPK